MAFKGRQGHGNAAPSNATKLNEQWRRNRSADKLLDQLLPQESKGDDADELDEYVREEELADSSPQPK